MKMIDLRCTECGFTKIDHLVRDVDEPPPYDCPDCGTKTFDKVLLPSSLGTVIADSIPGGIMMKNGICWPDGSPRRYDSWTDVKKAADAAGLVNRVEHIGAKGSDKSKYTVRWT